MMVGSQLMMVPLQPNLQCSIRVLNILNNHSVDLLFHKNVQTRCRHFCRRYTAMDVPLRRNLKCFVIIHNNPDPTKMISFVVKSCKIFQFN